MSEIITIEPKGIQTFQIGQSGEENPPFDVDLFRAHRRIREIQQEHMKGNDEEIPFYRALVRELGGPDCSEWMATAFVNQILDLCKPLMEELAKKNGRNAFSPGVIESIPSDCPPGSTKP